MTRRRTRLMLAVGTLWVAALVLAAAGERPEREQGGRAAQVAGGIPDRSRPTPAAPPVDPHGHDRRAGAAARRAGRRVARRFLGALLRYQAGRPPQMWQRGLEASSTRALASALASRPPRPPRSGPAPRGRLASLEAHGPRAGALRASAVVDYGAGSPSLVDLELRRAGGRWRVSRLYR